MSPIAVDIIWITENSLYVLGYNNFIMMQYAHVKDKYSRPFG